VSTEQIILKWIILTAAFIGGCTSIQGSREPESVPQPILQQLYANLKMATSLGFSERSFNSCGTKYHDNEKCGTRNFVSVGFRLLCRDSEDTVSEVAANLRPLVSDRVEWKLAGQVGYSKTNADGYGTIMAVTKSSAAADRLVLIVGNQFLGVDINQARQIVVPTYWCRQ